MEPRAPRGDGALGDGRDPAGGPRLRGDRVGVGPVDRLVLGTNGLLKEAGDLSGAGRGAGLHALCLGRPAPGPPASPCSMVSTTTSATQRGSPRSADRAAVRFRRQDADPPGQVESANRVYAPSDDEVETARRTIEAFEAARRRGARGRDPRRAAGPSLHVDTAHRVLAMHVRQSRAGRWTGSASTGGGGDEVAEQRRRPPHTPPHEPVAHVPHVPLEELEPVGVADDVDDLRPVDDDQPVIVEQHVVGDGPDAPSRAARAASSSPAARSNSSGGRSGSGRSQTQARCRHRRTQANSMRMSPSPRAGRGTAPEIHRPGSPRTSNSVMAHWPGDHRLAELVVRRPIARVSQLRRTRPALEVSGVPAWNSRRSLPRAHSAGDVLARVARDPALKQVDVRFLAGLEDAEVGVDPPVR